MPPDAHQLALAFLPGLQALLDGPFIDSDTHVIRHLAAFDAASQKNPALPLATAIELARLAAAINAWIMELNHLDGAGLDAATLAKLTQAPAKLQAALQLAVQTILAQNVVVAAPSKASADQSYHITMIDVAGRPLQTPAEVAEILFTLMTIDATNVKSPLLEAKIVGLFHWFAADVLAPMWRGQGESATLADLVWSKVALDAFAALPAGKSAAWLPDARNGMASALAAWDDGRGTAP